MEALRETTGGQFPPHVYLLEGNRLVAYIQTGTDRPFYFKNGIKGFDKRGRKFEIVQPNPFTVKATDLLAVKGSKGQIYYLDTETKTCTCPGYTFRGDCKHIKELR